MKLTPIFTALVFVSLIASVSAIERVDDKEYVSTYVAGDFVGTYEIGDQQASQAGVTPSEKFVLVLTDFGTMEFMPESLLNEQFPSEGVVKRKIGACSSYNECYNLGKDYCPTQNSNWVISKLSGTKCYQTATQIKTGTPGYCNVECIPSQQAGVCNSVTCKNDITCVYGTKSNAACSGSKCNSQKCYTYQEALDKGLVDKDSFCSESMTQDKIAKLCEDRCNDQYSSKYHATAASCRSNGELICGCTQERTVECSKTSDCNNLAITKCGSLDKIQTGYPKCNIEKGCAGKVFGANCLAPCKDTPTTVIPPEQIVKYVCGNGNCETPMESRSSCPLDCGTVSVTPSPTCTPGTREEFKCSGGKRLLQKSVFSSCVEQWNVIQECPEICSSGACVAAPTGSIVDPGTGDITLPGGIVIPPGGTDPGTNTTLPPENDDPAIVDYCGDKFCDYDANEDRTCKSDCPTTSPDTGAGTMSQDNIILFSVLLVVIIGISLLAWMTMRKK